VSKKLTEIHQKLLAIIARLGRPSLETITDIVNSDHDLDGLEIEFEVFPDWVEETLRWLGELEDLGLIQTVLIEAKTPLGRVYLVEGWELTETEGVEAAQKLPSGLLDGLILDAQTMAARIGA